MSADLYAAFVAEGATQPKQPKPKETTPSHARACPPSTPARGDVQESVQQKAPLPLWKRNNDGSDVLFDAQEADLNDDFGDFETVGKPSSDDRAPQSVNISEEASRGGHVPSLAPDLLDAGDGIPQPAQTSDKVSWTSDAQHVQTVAYYKRDSVARDDDWGEFEQTQSRESPDLTSLDIEDAGRPQAEAKESIADVPDDDWDPFNEQPSPAVAYHPADLTVPTSSGKEVPQATSKQTSATNVFERPTNVPPPSSLLQLLSTVFESIHKSDADGSMRKPELASKVLTVFRTASRIVFGRTLRWKRDTLLAQSVRIGQAGKSGGMKLASVNKKENTKEERDVAEMIQDWSNYVHEFNGILAQAEFPPQRMKLSPNPALKVLKHTNNPGSFKPCALCGLRRSERLTEVDVDVDDLFSEFWVEHWGHKDCCDFWYSYRSMLGQR